MPPRARAAVVEVTLIRLRLSFAGGAVQHSDRRIALKMPSYLAWRSSSTRACWASSAVRWMVGVVAAMPPSEQTFRRRWAIWTDHDLGRHTTDIDAGAADGAALDQRDTCARSTAFSAAAIAGPPLPMTAMPQCAAATPNLVFLPSRSRILSSNRPASKLRGIGMAR